MQAHARKVCTYSMEIINYYSGSNKHFTNQANLVYFIRSASKLNDFKQSIANNNIMNTMDND